MTAEQGAPVQITGRKMPAPVKLEGLAHELEMSNVEDFLDRMEALNAQSLKKAAHGSINMVTRYLKFINHKGVPIRRFFMGWTVRPKCDYLTKKPIVNEHGEQLYQPAAIFWTGEKKDSMEINQATELIKTLQESQVKFGDMLEITFEELTTLGNGHNQQKFTVIILKNDE